MYDRGTIVRNSVFMLFILTSWACDEAGDENGDARDDSEGEKPVVDFSSSSCNDGSTVNGAISFLVTNAALSLDTGVEEGLQCVAREVREDGSVAFDLINFYGSCGELYNGTIDVVAEDALNLELYRPACDYDVGCSCPYTFSLQTTGLDASADIQVEIATSRCQGEVERTDRFTFSPDMNWACKYSGTATDGALHGRCDDDIACGEYMVCDEVENKVSNLCLQACTVVEECHIPEAFSCDDNICKLKAVE